MNDMMYRYFIFSFTLFVSFISVLAQETYIPLHTYSYHLLDRREILSGNISSNFHTSLKPYSRKDVAEEQNLFNTGEFDTPKQIYNTLYLKREADLIDSDSSMSQRSIISQIYKDQHAFIEIDKPDFFLILNPVLYLQIGKENNNNSLKYINTRGLELRGSIDEKIGYYAFVGENQAVFPEYVAERIERDQAVPGQGFYKSFKTDGYDFFTARGYITFPISKHIRLQFGHDKTFIGNGYRSLILSDFSNNYLFLKFNTKIWRFNYQNLYTSLVRNYDRGGDRRLPVKYMSLHHLSINLTNWLNLGMFESIVSGQLDANYLNPIIFYRAIEQNLGSPDNALLGFEYKANFLKHFSHYGQLVVDEFNFNNFRDSSGWWGNKYGFQFGLKYIDVAGINNLDMQLEYNIVRPYTYTFRDSSADYTHYNQQLAHPFGANFQEYICILKYQIAPKILVTGKAIIAEKGIDTADATNWGGNIFLPYTTRESEYNNQIGQGVKQNIFIADLTASYQWKHNMFFELRYIRRNEKINVKQSATNFVALAFRMNIAQWDMSY